LILASLKSANLNKFAPKLARSEWLFKSLAKFMF
jgi:hypothetical protein